jgi:hypothetical protein
MTAGSRHHLQIVAAHKNVEKSAQACQIAAMETNRIVLEAIARGTCIEAVYNRMRVTLAPHILYTRHDELYVDAVTVARDGQPRREVKLGAFKLDGLHELAITDQPFERETVFDPDESRYAGVTLFAVA